MNEDMLFAQMGLILTQLRYARRALEDVERSTARYAGLGFATGLSSALSVGPRLGEPPLFNGALKVYVTNIQDLQPGGGIGGLIEGLLGGVGRFIGGLLGGTAGGLLSGLIIPFLAGSINDTATRVERIVGAVRALMDRVGSSPAETNAQAQRQQGGGGSDMPTLIGVVRSFTDLLGAANGGGGGSGAGGRSLLGSGDRWLEVITSVNRMLDGIERVVRGLIVLVPVLLGALAVLITRLDSIKLVLIDTLQFLLRNVLLLRGVALTTIYDTLAAVARMGAGLIGVISTAADGVLRTAFRIVGEVLTLAVQGLRFVAGALERTLNRLLPWVLDTVYGALTMVGESRLFRLLVHLTQVLPAILPGLHRVLNGTSAAPLPNESDLITLGRTTISAPSAAATTLPSTRFTPIMNLSELIVPDAAVTQLRDVVTQAGANITTNAGLLLAQAQDAVTRAGQEFTRAAGPGEAEFQRQFARHQREIQERADGLAGTLAGARRQAERHPETALHDIARAYEGWLTGGGMRILLGGYTALMREDQAAAAAARAGRPPLPRGAMDAARATIEIQDVVIELAPPAPQVAPGAAPQQPGPQAGLGGSALQRYLQEQHELEERGVLVGPGAAFTQVPA